MYPVGEPLPSQEELAQQKNVSVSTIRRALSLLSGVGAIKTARYAGSIVLPFDLTAKNSDFSNPVVHRRLIGLLESMQILALSCKDVSELSLVSMDLDARKQCGGLLRAAKSAKHYELVVYVTLDLFARFAPYMTIRMVYKELLQQFFWGHTLRSMITQEASKARYGPYLDWFIDFFERSVHKSIDSAEAGDFSAKLEELMYREFNLMKERLLLLGIEEASGYALPTNL